MDDTIGTIACASRRVVSSTNSVVILALIHAARLFVRCTQYRECWEDSSPVSKCRSCLMTYHYQMNLIKFVGSRSEKLKHATLILLFCVVLDMRFDFLATLRPSMGGDESLYPQPRAIEGGIRHNFLCKPQDFQHNPVGLACSTVAYELWFLVCISRCRHIPCKILRARMWTYIIKHIFL